jgi:hypothetical protein
MNKDTWDAITAAGTAVGALATAVMAGLTLKAIIDGQTQRKETNDHFEATREQEKQHHEDAFRPLLVLTPFDIMDPLIRQNIIAVQDSNSPLLVNGAVRNIGTGAALNIRMSVRHEGRSGVGPSRELTPMSAGSMLKNEKGRILVDVLFGKTFNRQDMSNLPNGHWIVVLEYEDVFGNPFFTLHAKNREFPWAKIGRGTPPDTTPRHPTLDPDSL